MSIANHNQLWPIMTSSSQPMPIHVNPCQSVPIRANPVPIGGQFFTPTQIRQFANPCQSKPIRANPCQSMPIRCQSVNPVPIGQSCANQPTQCLSSANPSPLVSLVPFLTSPELPILISRHGQSLAKPGQSGPLGERIQDNRAFPILTKPFHCQCTANAV